jgi:exodeoxyribonuclease VII small subunit
MEEFDYLKAVEALEQIAEKVEDPSTGLEDIDRYVKQSEELIAKCRAYLRTVREKVDSSFEK